MKRSLSFFSVVLVLFYLLALLHPAKAQAPKEITNSIGMKLVLIPKGTFMMGSPETEKGRQENETQHEVTISKDYYLGVYEVTQAQYEKVMGKNPSSFPVAKVGNENADLPVENVSWDDAVEFCKKLSDLPEEKKAGREYRLPTEAEWEYACRAGSKTAYAFDDEEGLLPEYGWFSRNSSRRTHTVGLLEPNAWGLYDMHGNVWEWCSDRYGDYPKGAVSDPSGPKGLVPCVPWRRLEPRGRVLSVGVPGRARPVDPHQRHRLSCCPEFPVRNPQVAGGGQQVKRRRWS
jgi:formylglycine-generating enzyme required for sulfatase activity